jgi:hypothetical protein
MYRGLPGIETGKYRLGAEQNGDAKKQFER